MKKLYAHEIIEIKIPAGSTATKFAIPDQPNLRDTQLMGVEFLIQELTPFSPLSQLPVVPAANLGKIFLTLVDNNGFEFLKLAPSQEFFTLFAPAVGVFEWDTKSFVGQIVNYPKSFITMSQALGNVADVVVLFSVLYLDPKRSKFTKYADRK